MSLKDIRRVQRSIDRLVDRCQKKIDYAFANFERPADIIKKYNLIEFV